LASQSFVQSSWHSPAETLNTNIFCQLSLFEAVRRVDIAPRIQIAGSSEEYGPVSPWELPIREDCPLRPVSPYAVSKVAQDLLGYQYFRSYQMDIVRTRAFNHSGPRRGEVFCESNFAKQIALAEVGLQEPLISVGNLEPARDYTDVRDIVRGYWLALERGKPGEIYNLCSGQSHTMQEVLDTLLGFSPMTFAVREDPTRLRPSDIPVLQGDCSRFITQTGWEPKISFTQMLRDLLDDWRAHVRVLAERQA
jgi:GDP-4-dehydro-6-deoxy-D-mannose reductase